jgi:Domain of unknown function (DUF6259)
MINRREFVAGLTATGLASRRLAGDYEPGVHSEQTWRSGQDSAVHDSDRLYAVSGREIVLENQRMRIAFDDKTGALIELRDKVSNWNIQGQPALGESFRMFVPTPGRDYNPILGARNKLSSSQRSPDGKELELTWSGLVSEYAGSLDITLRCSVGMNESAISFTATVSNQSPYTVDTVSWPILGALNPPDGETSLKHEDIRWATLYRASISPEFQNEFGYWGTNYPMSTVSSRFVMISAPKQGLYIGNHNLSQQEIVTYFFQLKPGYEGSLHKLGPATSEVSGHPVRRTMEVVHFPFVESGQSAPLSEIVIAPYQGDWHRGVDVYKGWKDTWFRRPPAPAWVHGVHSWQTLQIDSSEDDLRTPYRGLPARIAQTVRHGVAAVQLIGWNDGGQDRGDPSNNTDPRLGTYQELKDAIAICEKMGVHIILFNKYTYADKTTPWYKRELYKDMATDPYGIVYQHPGYQYQTPMQFQNINTRKFAVACHNSAHWREIVTSEFRKNIDLGASGILYDEAENHGGYDFCFSPEHGHKVPTTLWSGDSRIGELLRKEVRDTVGETNFLLAAEYPYDLELKFYSVSEAIRSDNLPADRYADPWLPMLASVTGFDDREMINRALMHRYILMYEPFNFKGNLDDFPLTMRYGRRVDDLRRRYKEFLWDAEFRDTLEAHVMSDGKPYLNYSVFRSTSNGKHAVVVVNNEASGMQTVQVSIDGAPHDALMWTAPETPTTHPYKGGVSIPARSAVVLIEQ